MLGFVNKLIDELDENLKYAAERAAAAEATPAAVEAPPADEPTPAAEPARAEAAPSVEPAAEIEADAESKTSVTVKKTLKKAADKFRVKLPDTLTKKQIRDIRAAIDVFNMQDPALQKNEDQIARTGDRLREILG